MSLQASSWLVWAPQGALAGRGLRVAPLDGGRSEQKHSCSQQRQREKQQQQQPEGMLCRAPGLRHCSCTCQPATEAPRLRCSCSPLNQMILETDTQCSCSLPVAHKMCQCLRVSFNCAGRRRARRCSSGTTPSWGRPTRCACMGLTPSPMHAATRTVQQCNTVGPPACIP